MCIRDRNSTWPEMSKVVGVPRPDRFRLVRIACSRPHGLLTTPLWTQCAQVAVSGRFRAGGRDIGCTPAVPPVLQLRGSPGAQRDPVQVRVDTAAPSGQLGQLSRRAAL
eukprot:TRINITY_DN233_c0_g1_i9.p1 TRINITY_DN233_c0_g1~~TRINITY_DN233_c0_g1_i9.p1  ORF type:complete len:109 (+),score=0.95 TRINITY_DN233_c0_g1_i9:108-434(+)